MKHTAMFTPAKIGRAGEDVALQIEAAILNGSIKPGESLASERDLQSVFETGRGVIREALRALKQKGLIEIRKGAKGGAFVRQVEMSTVSESLALFLKQHNVDPHFLVEFRESIDRTITALAVARAPQAEKEQLVVEARKLSEIIEGSPDQGLNVEELIEHDRQLNIRFARLAGNPVFEWTMRAVQEGLSSRDYSLYADEEFRDKTVDNWFQTARAIADSDQMRALSYIGYHYVLLRRCIDAHMPAEARHAA